MRHLYLICCYSLSPVRVLGIRSWKDTVPGLADSGCSLSSWERQCTQRCLDIFLQESTMKKWSDPHKRPSEFPIPQYFLADLYTLDPVYRDIVYLKITHLYVPWSWHLSLNPLNTPLNNHLVSLSPSQSTASQVLYLWVFGCASPLPGEAEMRRLGSHSPAAEQCRGAASLSPLCSHSGLITKHINRHVDEQIKMVLFPSFQPNFPRSDNVCVHTRTPRRPTGSLIPGRDHHMEGDGQSAVLRGRRNHSRLAAGLFPKCFGSLTHLYTEAGGGRKKNQPKNVTGLKARAWSCAKHP